MQPPVMGIADCLPGVCVCVCPGCQVAASPLEVGSALVLAASCAVNGRYLRDLKLSTRGAVLREQFPQRLPPAMPLGEPVTLLVRLTKMQVRECMCICVCVCICGLQRVC